MNNMEMRIGYKWSLIVGAMTLMVLGFLSISMTGCGTLSKLAGKQLTPYDQGYRDVESYVLVRPYVTEQHRAAVKALYTVVSATPDLKALTDTFLEVQVAKLYEGKATPEERSAILVLFRDARDSLIDLTKLKVDMPQDALFEEYMRGANDAVYYYGLIKQEETAAAQKAEAVSLLESLTGE